MIGSFELLSPDSVRIGGRVLLAHTHEPPLHGHWRHTVEAAGNDRHKPLQELAPHHLREVRPSDLPNGISISIYLPKSSWRDLYYLDIKKVADASTLTVTVRFDFQDWHVPLVLPVFLQEYRNLLLDSVENVQEVSVLTTETGNDVECKVLVSPEESYLLAYDQVCTQMLSTYRSAVSVSFGVSKPAKRVSVEPTTDAHGVKWWVRYVVVPVLGSGTVAAIVVGVLALLK